jgi:hypothetical protein
VAHRGGQAAGAGARSYSACFGFTLEDPGEAGAMSLEQRLRAIGLPVENLPRFPMPMASARSVARSCSART